MIHKIPSSSIETTSISDLPSFLASSSIESSFKLLNITNCAQSDVESLLSDKNFREFFEAHKTLFVLVIQLEGEIENEWDFTQESFVTQKPLIVSIEARESSSVFYKESFESNLKKICWWRDDEFFDFERLIGKLFDGIGGSFNGKLLKTAVDFDRKFEGLRFIDQAVHNNNILCIKFLRLFDFAFEDSQENEKLLEISALSCDSLGYAALLDVPYDSDFSVFMKLLSKINFKNQNLLLIASESGNVEGVNFLLKCSYDVNQQRDMNESAACIAWRKENFQIFVKLLKENSLFPEDFNEKLKQMRERGKVKNVLKHISDLNSLHENIKRGRLEQIKEFLTANPSTRYAYNIKNESAAAIALKSGQFGIYEFLISQGVCLGAHEEIDEILSASDASKCHDDRRTMMKKIYLHEIHKKYLKSPFEKHLMVLLSHSDIAFDVLDEEKRSYFKHIKEAFELLDEVEEISWILRVVAKSKSFRIVFDFNRDSVNFVDPTACK
jgi:hypothetical protein